MIIVFGSISMDMYLPVGKFPEPGEVVLSTHYDQYAGGKGANQALAAVRAGAKVALVGRTGDDGPGMRLLNGLRRDGVLTSGVARSEKSTGMAIVMTSPSGKSRVITAVGANMDVTNDQIPDEILIPKNMLLLQMETPPDETWILLDRAKKGGVKTILNLAPAINIPQESLEKLDYLIVNQIEARQLSEKLGINPDKNIEALAAALSQKGKLTCIVTMGQQGSVAVTPDKHFVKVPALQLENIVDCTGAGDAYCGTFAAAVHEGQALPDAMRMASVAGSLACLKPGAQDSYAYLGDIEENLAFLGEAVTAKI